MKAFKWDEIPENLPDPNIIYPIDRSLMEFSIVEGGPAFQLLNRVGLKTSIFSLVALTWLPLLVLSAVQGHLLRGQVPLPFVLDMESHVRFLLALPLLLIVERIAGVTMRSLLHQFIERGIVPPESFDGLFAARADAIRLRDSKFTELSTLGLVLSVGPVVFWYRHFGDSINAWYGVGTSDHLSLLPAGFWYAFVSLPIFQFLLGRWYLRLFIWGRFLFQVSRLKLNLIPTHPDCMAGLSFLPRVSQSLTPFAAAHGALLAGYLAKRIFFFDGMLLQFKVETGVMIAFVLVLIVGPLFVFVPQLIQAKRQGVREYGTLAARYTGLFHDKWVREGAGRQASLLGSADIQSLADMNNSISVVGNVGVFLVSRQLVILLVVATIVPVLPLLLTMMSAKEILSKLASIIF